MLCDGSWGLEHRGGEMGVAKQVVAVAVVVVEGQKLLALRRSKKKDAGAGLWEVVSGRLHAGEDPLAAAIRETREETGLEVQIVERPVDCYAAKRGDDPMTVIVYAALLAGGQFQRSAEHDDHRWTDLAGFEALGAPARLVEAARRAFATLAHAG